MIKIRKGFASGNVNVLYVTTLFFLRNWPFMSKETSKIQLFRYQQIACNKLHKRQNNPKITICRAPAMIV